MSDFNNPPNDFVEIYDGKHITVDLVDETLEFTIGLDTYSLSEIEELSEELKIVLKKIKLPS